MATYVVAGVTGRVGSVVADHLLARGEQPRVIVRERARGAAWAARGAEVAVGSLDDRLFLSDALGGADGFFTLLPENVTPDDFHGHRHRMADVIGEAVEQSRVRHVVMLSALSAVLADGNGPAKDLHYLENRLRGCRTTLTALRACYFQDNVASVVPLARNRGVYPNFMASADAAFPMIATKDVGRLAAEALTSAPAASETVDVLGPVYSIRQVADELGRALGRLVEVVDIPAAGHVEALTQAGLPRSVAEAVAEMFAAFNKGLIAPKGDRRLIGATPISEVIVDCVGRLRGAGMPA